MREHCILMVPAPAIGLCTPFTPVPLNAPAENAAQNFQQLATQLALDQQNQLIPIIEAEAPRVKEIKTDSSLTPIQRLQQIKAVHDQTDPQVKAILRPQQFQEIQVIRRQELQCVIARKPESVKVASNQQVNAAR
jgi:hypothetical protein